MGGWVTSHDSTVLIFPYPLGQGPQTRPTRGPTIPPGGGGGGGRRLVASAGGCRRAKRRVTDASGALARSLFANPQPWRQREHARAPSLARVFKTRAAQTRGHRAHREKDTTHRTRGGYRAQTHTPLPVQTQIAAHAAADRVPATHAQLELHPHAGE